MAKKKESKKVEQVVEQTNESFLDKFAKVLDDVESKLNITKIMIKEMSIGETVDDEVEYSICALASLPFFKVYASC